MTGEHGHADSQSASPNAASPTTCTIGTTDRAERGLGSSESWNSLAEPNLGEDARTGGTSIGGGAASTSRALWLGVLFDRLVAAALRIA